MKYDIITIGGATYDITIFPAEKETLLLDNKKDILRQKLLAFEYGAKIKIDRLVQGFGGGAANAAVCFSRLGFKTAAIVAAGDDNFGEKIIANLKKKGVAANLVQKIKGKESALAIVVVGPDSARDHTIFSDDKVKSMLRIGAKEKAALGKTNWIYLASLSGKWKEILEKIFAVKRQNQKIGVAWNPGQDQLAAGISKLSGFLKQADVFILNQDEAIQLAVSDPKIAKKKNNLNNARNLLHIVKNYGPKIVVVTSGKNGAWAYDGKKIYYTPIVKEQKRVDTTGVGDTFGSSFVAGMNLYRGDIFKAMRLGILNTAKNVAEPGAQNGLLSKNELRKLNI